MTCPKCGADQPVGGSECVRCGVIFARIVAGPRAVDAPEPPAPAAAEPEPATATGLRRWLLPDNSPVSAPARLGRLALLVPLLVWSVTFLRRPVGALGDSSLHLVDLPFHEAGHILFTPFGAFMTSLGGSLTQILVPLVCAIALLIRGRDPFGAAVGLWWCGQNFLDLAPYIDDARALQMVLLGGRTGAEVEGHDWEAILTRLGWLHLDHALARGARTIGSLVMIVALVWATAVLWTQRERRRGRG